MGEKDNKKEKKTNFWLQYFIAVMAGALTALLLKFTIGPVQINGNSMYPTLKDGECYTSRVFFDEDDLVRGTIVIFDSYRGNDKYVKRLVAVPGDSIEIKDGYLYVNGELSYNYGEILDGGIIEDVELTLGEDEWFCMGDNRNTSYDCRAFGPISKERITHILRVDK